MTGASKILTVSYGTFSCTLEGFDDPFNTMKAIAEYFRDLAAGDRYFGAEPPTPDAAMLHRIAEREIQRRVEAKVQDNGVILRAGEAAGQPAPEAPPRPALLDAETTAESVAARLQRIRARHAGAVQAETASALSVSGSVDQADAYDEDQHAEDVVLAAPAIAETIEIPDQIEEILDAAEQAEAPDAPAVLPAEVEPEAAPAQPEAAFDVPEALMPSAEAPQDPSADDMPADDLPEAWAVATPDSLIEEDDQDAGLLADEAMLAGFALDLTEVAPETAAPGAVLADLIEDLPEAYAQVDLTEAAPDMADLPEETADTGLDDDALLSRLAASAPEPDARIEDETEALTPDDPQEPVEAAAEIENVDQTASTPAADSEPEDAPDPAADVAPRARARVIRIRRTEAPVAAELEPAPAAPALSDEAEAALQAELAALEAEISAFAETGPQPDADPFAEVVANLPGAGAPLPEPHHLIAEDVAVDRLMAQAASEMGDEKTRRRQSAIAHLKAAVAATQADRMVTGAAPRAAESRMEAYRSDLDRVVRPRRPVSEGATPRPGATAPEALQRPTPLVLVSAQRIDRAPAGEPAREAASARLVMPVRPRRISSAAPVLSEIVEDARPAPTTVPAPMSVAPVSVTPARITPKPAAAAMPVVMQNPDQTDYDEDDILAPGETANVFVDATSFQDFADQLGASALPDLLEAAAVYCAEVLQRPEFSRPLIMRQIAGLPGKTDTAREDYLRGFGTLLRQGRITKVKRGMFALTDRSPYLAEARKQVG